MFTLVTILKVKKKNKRFKLPSAVCPPALCFPALTVSTAAGKQSGDVTALLSGRCAHSQYREAERRGQTAEDLPYICRALALNCDAALNDKDGAESKNWRAGKPVRVVRSSKGRRISKYAPEDGNRYDGIYKVVKYWPEIGKCGFLVWRYLLRRDDMEPAPWTPEGTERSKKLGLTLQFPEGYLEAMANKEKKDKVKKQPVKSEPSSPDDVEEVVPPKLIRRSEEGGEAFQLTEQQHWLIKEDSLNQKLWDEVLSSIKEGPMKAGSHRAHMTDVTVWRCRGERSAAYNILQHDRIGSGGHYVAFG
ncbi:unnamed protein product [Ranitomeya imitator]|uniref:RING-type E3 ubiquitin transferase n=1 Tax=Ranitomeya imitator TaxID=111125 RepID=A0ABN9KU75_9NEOB|nr:unnamed protein product [Ranitomeya imitator]